MGSVGNYDKRFTWYQFVRLQDDTYGDVPDMFASNGSLWGSLKFIKAYEAVLNEQPLSVTEAEVRIHNEVSLGFRDELALDGDRWKVTGCFYNESADETLATVVRERE